MFDIGWTELLVIGIVALIVVGDDLPTMFRTLGRFTAKMRRMASEFQRAMEDAADDAGVKDAAADLKNLTSPRKLGLDAIKDAADKFDKWEPGQPARAIGSETAKLTQKRADQAQKIREATARAASERQAAETAAPDAGGAGPARASGPAGKSPAKKPAAKKPAAKKPATKKPAAKPAKATGKSPAGARAGKAAAKPAKGETG